MSTCVSCFLHHVAPTLRWRCEFHPFQMICESCHRYFRTLRCVRCGTRYSRLEEVKEYDLLIPSKQRQRQVLEDFVQMLQDGEYKVPIG